MFGYFLLVFVLVVLIAVIYFVFHQYKLWAHSHYECPSCNEDFTPANFFACLFAYYPKGYRRLKCPKCGHKEIMKGIRD